MPQPVPEPVIEPTHADDATIREEVFGRYRPAVLRGLVKRWQVVQAALASPADLARYLAGFDSRRPVDAILMPPAARGRIAYNEAMGFVSAAEPAHHRRMTVERLESKRAIVGEGFEIRRALPNRHRRMIGAWCFLDHAGPADYPAGGGLVIGPHPHIGLQTFTWMIEGSILHTDSLGYRQWIRPGQVNLMTAGRGISHAEDSPADAAGRFQLAQLWIALPDAERRREPSFHHYPELPVLERGGFRVTVLAGNFAGERAPAAVYSPLVGLDLAALGPARAGLALDASFEHGVMALEGSATVDG